MAAPLSASCLTYLFADRVIGGLTFRQRLSDQLALEVPSSSSLVSLSRLQRDLLATALWSLSEQGHIEIRRPEPSRVDAPASHTSLNYKLRFRRTKHPGHGQQGIEALLLDLLDADRPVHLGELIGVRWLNREFLALNGIVVLAQHEALLAGVITKTEDRPPRSRKLAWTEGHARVVGHTARLSAVEPQFVAMVDRRFAYQDRHPDTWGSIVHDCGVVLYSVQFIISARR